MCFKRLRNKFLSQAEPTFFEITIKNLPKSNPESLSVEKTDKPLNLLITFLFLKTKSSSDFEKRNNSEKQALTTVCSFIQSIFFGLWLFFSSK